MTTLSTTQTNRKVTARIERRFARPLTEPRGEATDGKSSGSGTNRERVRGVRLRSVRYQKIVRKLQPSAQDAMAPAWQCSNRLLTRAAASRMHNV